MEPEYEKILFRFYSEIFDKEMTESMWAIVIDRMKGLYKIDNIPSYIPMIAPDDIIVAEFDNKEGFITYKRIKEYSENSVIQVIIMNDNTEINEIRDLFFQNGCPSEQVNDSYFSMEIPKEINYKPVKTILEKLEQNGIVGYSEPCLSNKHKIEIS